MVYLGCRALRTKEGGVSTPGRIFLSLKFSMCKGSIGGSPPFKKDFPVTGLLLEFPKTEESL